MDALERSVHILVEPARAFAIFTAHMRAWWDPSVRPDANKAPIVEIVLEQRVDGRWYERRSDGSEFEWAHVVIWEPPSRLVVDWHPNGLSTELEVRFDGPAPRRTDVTIIHRGLERFGNQAERMRALHEITWVELLQRFATYVSQHASVQTPTTAGERSARGVTDGETILATMDIAAAPERIFRALTTAEVEAWWGSPDTYRTTGWRSDTRVGGRWSVVTRLSDGSAFPASGQYVELEARGPGEAHRIVLTRRYDWDYPELGRRETTVTYRLDPVPDGTRVTIRQDGFAGLRAAAEHHVEGWVKFLSYLAAYVGTPWATARPEAPLV